MAAILTRRANFLDLIEDHIKFDKAISSGAGGNHLKSGLTGEYLAGASMSINPAMTITARKRHRAKTVEPALGRGTTAPTAVIRTAEMIILAFL